MLCVFSDFNELIFVFCKQKYFFESLLFQTGVSSSSKDLSLLKRQSVPMHVCLNRVCYFSGAMAGDVCPFKISQYFLRLSWWSHGWGCWETLKVMRIRRQESINCLAGHILRQLFPTFRPNRQTRPESRVTQALPHRCQHLFTRPGKIPPLAFFCHLPQYIS